MEVEEDGKWIPCKITEVRRLGCTLNKLAISMSLPRKWTCLRGDVGCRRGFG